MSATGGGRLGWMILAGIVAILGIAAISLYPSHKAVDDRPVLRIADQQGALESLLVAAGENKPSSYRIEWTRFPSGPAVVEAMNAHVVDVGLLGDASLIIARSAGMPIKAITVIRGNVTGLGIFVPANSPIRTIADLRGKSIGVLRNSALHLMTIRILKSAGMTERDVSMKFLNPSDARAAFHSGGLDAWAALDPMVAVEELGPNPPSLIAPGGAFMLDAVYIVASEEAIAKRRPELGDFIQRLAAAYRWSNAHKPEFAQQFSQMTKLPLPVTERMVNRRSPRVTDVDDALIRDLDQAANDYFKAGAIDHTVSAATFFDRGFHIGH